MRKNVRRVLAAVLLAVLAVSGGYIAWKSLDYQKGGEDYAEAVEVAGLELPEELPPARTQDAPQTGEEDGDLAAERDPWAAALAQVDLEALRQVNGDVVGWIAIPGTVLSYPVVQTGDNSYYLNRTWKRESSSVGAIFLEHTAAADLSGFHTLIYGHRMRNGTMFAPLRRYAEQDYWAEHPDIYVTDGTQVYRYAVFAAWEPEVTSPVYARELDSEEARREMIEACLSSSVIETGVVPGPEDRLLTLSTCTGTGHATRWVVQGKLVDTYPQEAE